VTVVAPGFGRVETVFQEICRGGFGAAFAAVVDGQTVVDLWGGHTERDIPWQKDTNCLIFSGTKGVVSTAVLMLVDRGLLRLDQRVSEIWPEFGAAGKSGVTVAHVLSHTAGLPGIKAPISRDRLIDQPYLASLLAAQEPMTPIGQPSYHAFTFGTLCDALIRKLDSRSIGRFVADEIAGPLGLDFWIGAPEAVAAKAVIPTAAADFQLAAMLADPRPELEFVYRNPDIEGDWRPLLTGEAPSANGITNARSMARLYGCLAAGGELDGVRLLGPDVLALARTELSSGPDVLSGRMLRFGAGFELAGTPSQLGRYDDLFGFTGSGGSSHGAWPSRRTGFSFMMAEMRPETTDDRARRILEALADAIG